MRITDYWVEFDEDLIYCHFTADIEEMVQTAPATLIDPPQYGTASCKGYTMLDADENPPEPDSPDMMMLAFCVDNWEVIR